MKVPHVNRFELVNLAAKATRIIHKPGVDKLEVSIKQATEQARKFLTTVAIAKEQKEAAEWAIPVTE